MADDKPRFRIVSDGTPHGTKVTSERTGEDFTGIVRSIKWEVGSGLPPEVTICFAARLFATDVIGLLSEETKDRARREANEVLRILNENGS